MAISADFILAYHILISTANRKGGDQVSGHIKHVKVILGLFGAFASKKLVTPLCEAIR